MNFNHRSRKFYSLRLSFLLLLVFSLGMNPVGAISTAVQGEALSTSPDLITVIAVLKQQATQDQRPAYAPTTAQRANLLNSLKLTASTSQEKLISWLDSLLSSGKVIKITPFWIINGVAITATPDVIDDLKQRADILSVIPEKKFTASASIKTDGNPDNNLTAIHIVPLWQKGIRGAGVVVANLDTGVDATQIALSANYRCAPSTGPSCWFDPYHANSQNELPYDTNGHGTATMGIIAGGDYNGTTIGVAPDAKWIAAKIFDDQGYATTSVILSAFQWILAPGGNPANAPQVVNNSWDASSAGCDLTFQLALQNLRAAGILPIFAAGNYGPTLGSSTSPANLPEAFSVGAVDDAGNIQGFSSRGPTTCGGSAPRIFPNLVAPGLAIHSVAPQNLDTYENGTSLSAPHVAGTLALIISAYPGLPVTLQEQALLQSAVDLGMPGPDNLYGYGLVDGLAAYQWVTQRDANSVYLPYISNLEAGPIYLPMLFST